MENVNVFKTEKIDEEIRNIDNTIFENIERDVNYDRGFMSQNILTRLRNLIEHTCVKILSNVKKSDLEANYDNIQEALKYVKNIASYKILIKFHRFVQNSVGHLTPTNENAERLMLKYYEYLIRLKKFYEINYNMEILKNIDKFPLNTDKTYYEYYGEISNKIDNLPIIKDKKFIEGKYYIQKIKPFFINYKIYYEVTLSPAVDNISKFDRITMFTKCEINTNYSIKISISDKKVNIFGELTDIQIIDNWQISIRPCEITNFYKIFGNKIDFYANYKEYREIMLFLTSTGYNFLDLADMEKENYEKIKEYFCNEAKTTYIFNLIDKCRNIISKNKIGINIIRYLLYIFNNRIIKKQLDNEKNEILSNLNIKYKSIPFEKMPLVTSLCEHNPKSYDLFECFDIKDRKDELLARYLQINTEQNGCLYTGKSELEFFGNVDQLVSEYNSRLYYKHTNRKIIIDKDKVFIKGYEENTIEIIKKLQELSNAGVKGFSTSAKFWISQNDNNIDDDDKKQILENLFENSKVALIYGAAGTGKTTMIKHISNYYNIEKKIYLANTHPAIENLKRKVNAQNCEFYTIKKILSKSYINRDCDVLIIDECSTVSNEDMVKIIREINFKLLILVGDIYQIESIVFGNWFNVAKILIDNKAKYELVKPYRTKNDNLKELWDRVRNLDDEIIEWIAKNKYSQKLGKSILNKSDDDEIILCLNYDGLYGINNINRFMQNGNHNPAFNWGIGIYKVGDPVLFNESNRFSPIIYNNLKGKIVNIELEEKRIWFDIEMDIAIDDMTAENAGLILIDNSEDGKSIVRFYVNQFKDLDDDDDLNSESVVPFVVSYAVSIHKAQGLEYNSVKIIITQEIEEMISHNIFYTAITRARENLKIYWTPECENRIISTMRQKFNGKDASIIRNKINK